MDEMILYDHTGSICSQMARLALIEKGLAFRRRNVDIMQTAEQFEPWYLALNPKAVVPTLMIGDEVVTDTIRIVGRVNEFDGPDLGWADRDAMDGWLADIMGLHYGVLLYSARLDADRTSPTIIKRGQMLRQMAADRPETADLLKTRIEGNARFQAILASPDAVAGHIDAAQALVGRMEVALDGQDFIGHATYSLVDAFATAALARFALHGFDHWWVDGANNQVAAYYERMKARPSFSEAGVLDHGSERKMK